MNVGTYSEKCLRLFNKYSTIRITRFIYVTCKIVKSNIHYFSSNTFNKKSGNLHYLRMQKIWKVHEFNEKTEIWNNKNLRTFCFYSIKIYLKTTSCLQSKTRHPANLSAKKQNCAWTLFTKFTIMSFFSLIHVCISEIHFQLNSSSLLCCISQYTMQFYRPK